MEALRRCGALGVFVPDLSHVSVLLLSRRLSHSRSYIALEARWIAMLKSGADHIASLRDDRAVYLHGKKVDDVTVHPAFTNAVKTIGGLFDFATRQPELMSFATGKGERANRIWQLPESYEELCQRRRALEAWSGLHAGFMGRAPDHVASCISGMYMGLDVFEAYDMKRAAALADYYRHASDNDLYLN